MIVRSALFACAAAVCAMAQPAFAETAPARCEPVHVRVYFAPGASGLDAPAREMLALAARQTEGCAAAELVVRTGGGALARTRGEAVLAALSGRDWHDARVEPGMQRVSAGPDFVEVGMGIGVAAAPAARPTDAEV